MAKKIVKKRAQRKFLVRNKKISAKERRALNKAYAAPKTQEQFDFSILNLSKFTTESANQVDAIIMAILAKKFPSNDDQSNRLRWLLKARLLNYMFSSFYGMSCKAGLDATEKATAQLNQQPQVQQ